MKNIKNVIVISLILILLIINFITVSYAEPVKVTKENLKEAFEVFLEEGESEVEYEIDVLDDVIEISMDGEEYQINYDLTDKPTFSVEASITQGMTYDEFEKQSAGMMLPMMSYMAVSYIQGVELEDSGTYLAFNILGSALSNLSSSSAEYVIYDDRNTSEDKNFTSDKEVIYASEFGNHAMEYINSSYKTPVTMTDSEQLNSYTWKTEQKDVTDTSCKVVSTLIINTDANFSKTKEFVEEIENSMKGSINNTIGSMQNSIESSVVNATDTSNSTNITKLPQTGEGINAKDILYGIILFAVMGVITLYIYSKRINQDK